MINWELALTLAVALIIAQLVNWLFNVALTIIFGDH